MPHPPTERFAMELPIGDDPADVPVRIDQPFRQIDKLAAKYDQGAHAARPAATAATKGMLWRSTDRRLLYECTGTEWHPLAVPDPVVTELPNAANSWDGMQVEYLHGAGSWTFRRRGPVWVYRGGSPLVTERTTVQVIASGGANLYLSVVPPLAGTYDVQFGVTVGSPTGNACGWNVALQQGASIVGRTYSGRIAAGAGASAAALGDTISAVGRVALTGGAAALRVESFDPVLFQIRTAAMQLEPHSVPVA